MSKIEHLKRILGRTGKQKVLVSVGGKDARMTETQSYRFSELNGQREAESQTAANNPLEESRYGIEDAAFRLFISEEQLLRMAADGSVRLYTDAAGLTGQWQRGDGADAVKSSFRPLKSGFLALSTESCHELMETGITSVSALDFCSNADPAATNVDRDTLETLQAWGQGHKRFFLQQPILVDRDKVVLMAPLLVSD